MDNYCIDSFSVENYRSFFKKQTIFFTSSIQAIYGGNASGKSNLYKAMLDFKRFIQHSDSLESSIIPYKPFLLSNIAKNEPSTFSITFHNNSEAFLYSFSINHQLKIVEECLLDISGIRPRTIFIRSKSSTPIATRHGFGKKMFIGNSAVNDNTLLITASAGSTKNHYAKAVLNAIQSINMLDLTCIKHLRDRTAEILNIHPEIVKELLVLMKKAGTDIDNISIQPIKITPEMLSNINIPEDLKKQLLTKNQEIVIRTTHQIRDENGNIKGFTLFNMDEYESLGTNNFFILMTWILDALHNNKTIYIDEFGSSLHTNICNFIINYFKKTNENNNSKLIINTHDIGLIKSGDFGTLEKEEIIIMEKDDQKQSIMTPLSKRSKRQDENTLKKYLMGYYGGVPEILND